MIEGYGSVVNSFLGTLVTWGMTAAGSALVFVLPKGEHRTILDASLGFAAGVMIAASFWSLLQPSIDKARELGYEWEWFPAAVGFFLGGLGIAAAEKYLPEDSGDVLKQLGGGGGNVVGSSSSSSSSGSKVAGVLDKEDALTTTNGSHKLMSNSYNGNHHNNLNGNGNHNGKEESYFSIQRKKQEQEKRRKQGLRRILMLVLAITIHNFPEGLAVGVAFGAVETGSMTIREARALAWGIGLQNFPEGLAVSMPLYRQGMSSWQSFWFGQLSGMVEPIAGVLGALLIQYANPVLPYALSFAAGAMIYVVVDDLIPEVAAAAAAASSNGGASGDTSWSTWGCMIGFIVMMVLDVALG